jgi:GNAT superfamily N-acetyltransferase
VVADDRYELDDNPARLDLDVVWTALSEEAYWQRWRTRSDVEQQFRSAWRVVGAYERSTGSLIGFARAISDGIADGYLCDVFVDASHRGQGIGGRLVDEMVNQGRGATFRWFLSTRDAHRLYARLGFLPADERMMERPGRSS